MKNYMMAMALAVLLTANAASAESARTVRATDLKAQAQSDAATLVTLPENARVNVLRRSGAWSEIRTVSGQTGWVRMLSLRFDDAAPQGISGGAANPVGALNNLLTSGRASATATVTTGVRGLTAEELQNAQANPAEVQKLQRFAAQKDSAQAFARRSNLSPVRVDYLPEPTRARQDPPTFDGG